ncbi:MAG: class I SAM-dependent methyltransferase [Aristaeellaceae bacterium]
MDYQQLNADTIDKWCRDGWEWGVPITHEAYVKAQQGDWQVFLTPTKPVPRTWLGDLRGKRVLGLASGGGQQMPVFTALGAECTVLDYSPQQCESERLVAEREGYDIRIVRADMTRPLPFPDESFDLIFHPVSNCYVEEVRPIFRECFRVLKHGGALLCGLDNGVNFIFDEDETTVRYSLPFNPLKDPTLMEEMLRKDLGVQFSHTLEEQIGGQLEAGLRLTDVYEDNNGTGNLAAHGIPTFWATRAVKE